MVPEQRIQRLNKHPIRPDGAFVVYWMTAFRRLRYNFALERAVETANQLGQPLLIFEAVRTNYRWACDRFHRFLIDGMIDNAERVAQSAAAYCGYVEPCPNHGHGLMESIAKQACVVVTDDYPCFFHPKLYSRIAKDWDCAIEIVDSNTILPMREADRTFTVAHSYRRHMQKVVHAEMPSFPLESPLERLTTKKLKRLPDKWNDTWGLALDRECLKSLKKLDISALPIDHAVEAVDRGGEVEGGKVLDRFLKQRLKTYANDRNEPELAGSSWLSPYMHFGNVSPHEVFLGLAKACDWDPSQLSKPNGKMNGFWNMGEDAEAFLDQLMTWREIGFNMCAREPQFDRYESLPDWAQETLADHVNDKRPYVYSMDQFDMAQTHDPLWNAAQNQLRREGRIHNYLRMLWGKKILHWTETPRDALKVMIHLNNKYALDGRDPNSYSGIFWVLGRYDRAWGPERPIFGKIRYMTSESTQSKYSVKQYIRQYS
jgi:deoxyribodipyrimidine photo-lyase